MFASSISSKSSKGSLFSLLAVITLSVFLLNGCASNAEHQNKLNKMAYSQENLLSTSLPIEINHLKITKVTANKNVVNMQITFNPGRHFEQTLQMLMDQSIARYCRIPSIRKDIDFGLVYHLKIRNTQGQPMMEKEISKTSCH